MTRKQRSCWGSLHTHSQFSQIDGMVPVPQLVEKAARMGQPFIGLTDHGNMAGTIQLYKAGKKYGIKTFPGFEAYLADPNADDPMDAKADRYHLCLLARNLDGYKALVKYNSLSHTRPRFSRFPRLTIADLASLGKEAGDGIILLTGCYFGLVQQTLERDGSRAAERVIKTYASWFPHTFVEIQNHNIVHREEKGIGPTNDIEMAEELVLIADRLGLPVMATQDSHYLDQRQKSAHALMKRMVYGGAEDEFPGDSFHLASADWVREHFPDAIWDRVEEASKHVLGLHELQIPPLDEYKPHVPMIERKEPDAKLRRLVMKALDRITDGMSARKKKRYLDQAETELATIKYLGYANYFLLVRLVVRECERRNICVEARGSANGSLVCYALGITQADPIKWGTMFERFLSHDRIKPPDIDLDVEDTRRGEILEWLGKKFPTVQIGTWSELGESADNPDRGSVLVSYLSYLRRKSVEMAREKLGPDATKKDVEEYGGRIFGKRYRHIETISDVKDVSKNDYHGLRELARMKSVYRSYGVHAAGVLLGSESLNWREYVPTMLVASSDTIVTQFSMDDIEELGLLKLDLLGQTTLTVMRQTQELIGRDNPTDFRWIPEDDRAACRILREGRTDNGIFHFEGYALPDETPVLQRDGWKPIGQLKVGDRVVDPDGGEATVTGVFPQGVEQVYEVKFGDGSSVEASASHLWTYRLRHSAFKNRGWQVGSTTDLIDYVRKGYRVQLKNLGWVDLGDGSLHTVEPYRLGLLLGDGALSQKRHLRFTSADEELVLNFKTRKITAYDYYVSEPDLYRAIGEMGLLGKRSWEKSVPTSYLWTSAENRLALLQGLMDTDGSVDKQGRMEFCSVSHQLAKDVVFLVRSLGGKCALYRKEQEPVTFPDGHTSECRDSWQVRNIRFADQSIVPFRLARKVVRVRDDRALKEFTIKEIVPTRMTKTTCISVNSPSECFVTKDWIVTHNTKAKGGREMGIKSTKDAILASALYMPGAMDSGQKDLYLRYRRNKNRKPKYLHPIFESALSDTYGAVIFQEQPLSILRSLGMSIENINVMFKIVKDSGKGAIERNADRLASLREEFDKLCEQHGIEDTEKAWHLVTGFIAYGFNRAHATGYGIRSYRCAYLKAHHPLEFMTALLTVWSGKGGKKKGESKEKLYEREARRLGIRLMPPHVNISGVSWTMDERRKAIRRGLLSIPGIGMAAASEIASNAPYESITDLVTRCSGRAVSGGKKYLSEGVVTGKLKNLMDAGALKGLDD